MCSLVCKWAYDASSGSLTDHGWCDEFLSLIGLQDLTNNDHEMIGNKVNAPGQVTRTLFYREEFRSCRCAMVWFSLKHQNWISSWCVPKFMHFLPLSIAVCYKVRYAVILFYAGLQEQESTCISSTGDKFTIILAIFMFRPL